MLSSGQVSNVGSLTFQNFGSHCDNYPVHYLTVACAIGKHYIRKLFSYSDAVVGMRKEDIDVFIEKFDDLLS